MKKFTLILLSAAMGYSACKKSEVAAPPVNAHAISAVQADSVKNFTSVDADTAYAAFNRYFYNPTNKLYYNATDKSGVGAIWTQAIFWDMAMDNFERTHKPSQLKMIADIHAGAVAQYDNFNWNNTTTWFIYDDMMWWVTALARAHQLTGNPQYLQESIAGFNHVWAGSYDPVAGGMFWDFQHSGKNACINYPTVIAAVRLFQITHNPTYLSKAKSIYAWARANLVNPQNGEIADHKIGDNPPGYQDYTYNQGTAIGAAVMLYQVTHDPAYIADAKLYADYTENSMCTNGILPAEGDFNEQGVMKAIFAQYIMTLIKDAHQTQYRPWIINNINTGWNNRDRARNLTWRNYALPAVTGVEQSYEGSSIPTFMQVCPAP